MPVSIKGEEHEIKNPSPCLFQQHKTSVVNIKSCLNPSKLKTEVLSFMALNF